MSDAALPPALQHLAGAVDMVDHTLVAVPLEAWDGHADLAAQIAQRLISTAVELDHTAQAFGARQAARARTTTGWAACHGKPG